MNIIIDIRCLLEPNYSGVPAYSYNLLQNLLKIDQKNQYYLFYNKFQKHSEIIKKISQLNNLLNYQNVQLADFHYPNKFFNFSLRFFKYPQLDKLVEKKIGTKIDVWFSPNLGFVNFSHRAGSATSWSLPDGFKFILTIHDLSFERYPKFFASKRNFGVNYIRGRFWHKYVGAKKICEVADKIIAVSESTKNDLMDIYKIPQDKIKVIYEGANASQKSIKSIKSKVYKVESGDAKFCVFEGESELLEIRKEYNLPEKFILFLGTLEPRKNISSIIRAFEKLHERYNKGAKLPIGSLAPSSSCSAGVSQARTPAYSASESPAHWRGDSDGALEDYNLIIAGKRGWLYDDLFKLAKKSKAKDKIKFIGYVSEEDKPALYKLASLFVFPSFYEGFGLPPLEAMAFGAPVIASATFSLSEVVGDAGILINPYDVNELAEAMKLVLSDDKLRERLIEKGLKRSEMFSWEKAARESLWVFEHNPQKILIDARMAGTQNAGIGRSIEELIKNLIKLDTENEYYLFLTKENFFLMDKWFDALDKKKFHKILVDARWYTLKEQLILPKEIQKIKPDLAYFPHFNVPLFCREKFIITIHDLIWIKYPRPRKEISTLGPVSYGIKNFFSKIVFRSAVKRAQTIITPTEFTKKDIIDFCKIKPDKIKVINWGVDNCTLNYETDKIPVIARSDQRERQSNPVVIARTSGLLRFARNDFCNSRKCGEQTSLLSNNDFLIEKKSDNRLKKCYNINKPYFLYVGSAYPHKNLIFLLEVFKNINKIKPDFQLVLAGKESYFYKKLEQKVKELGLESKVVFTDYVDDKDLSLLYERAFLFVFPSLLEGFGFPPLEAMKFGLPIVSSNSSCLPEIFGDTVLYFDPINKKELEEKILSIINNQNLREKLIQKGFEQIKKYDWKRCAEKYLDVIKL